jgi:hypothetical protein
MMMAIAMLTATPAAYVRGGASSPDPLDGPLGPVALAPGTTHGSPVWESEESLGCAKKKMASTTPMMIQTRMCDLFIAQRNRPARHSVLPAQGLADAPAQGFDVRRSAA